MTGSRRGSKAGGARRELRPAGIPALHVSFPFGAAFGGGGCGGAEVGGSVAPGGGEVVLPVLPLSA